MLTELAVKELTRIADDLEVYQEMLIEHMRAGFGLHAIAQTIRSTVAIHEISEPHEYLFWDKDNDEFEFLDENGDFYLYGQDIVLIDKGDWDGGQHWIKAEKLCDETPLRDWERYLICNPANGEWLDWEDAPDALIVAVRRRAGCEFPEDYA